jgi:hypothetical protein
MIYIIIILVVLLGILTFALVNSLRKYEILEGELEATDKLIETVYISMQKALLRMTSIDRLGSFEADDESGFIFEEIKSAMEVLNNEYNLDGETQEEEK